jgi:hypothetical protein
MNPKQLVEIARSFSYKLNCGNYESRDFFCSQKAEVPFEEAEETSNALYHFCKSEVVKAVNAYKKEQLEPMEDLVHTFAAKQGKMVDIDLGDGQGEFPKVYRAKNWQGEKEVIDREAGTLPPQ